MLYVDPDAGRRAVAESLGAQTSGETAKRLGPFPVTVDACGEEAGLGLALRSTAPDGICTSCAIYFGEQPSLPMLEMYTKGITLVTGRANAREAMPHVLGLAASGALHPELVTSTVVAWHDAPEALARGGVDEARVRALAPEPRPRFGARLRRACHASTIATRCTIVG